MVVLAALAASVAIGTGDFLAGVVGRRDRSGSALTVVFATAAALALPIAVAVEGAPELSGIGWGALMGLGFPIGIFVLMRGVAEGRVVVVVPVSGVLTALVPVLVDLASGDPLSRLVASGVALAIVALLFTGIGHEHGEPRRSVAWSTAMGAIAGILTGGFYVVLDHAASSGYWVLAANGAVAAILTIATLGLTRTLQKPDARTAVSAAAIGGLLLVAFAALVFAFERGSLTVVSVLASQYPAVTILLAALIWRQRPRGIQYIGVASALVAVGMIAAGA
jgi:drug/metabolite transporter (DMT)-like permease